MNTRPGTSALVGLLTAALLLPAAAARADGTARAVFLDSLEALRRHDATVRSVMARVMASGGFGTGCGVAPEGDLVLFYCPRDRSIYAATSSLAQVRRNFGDPAVRYVAAHEMAHGRQHAVTGFAGAIVKTAVLDELQADCIAGAYLRRVYGYTVDSEAGRQALRFAYSIGDRAYFHRDWHGNPRLRVAALSRGLRQGEPARCLSSSRFNYGTLIQQGANWLRELRNR